jgi:di/tricarboxylate transporter
MSAKSIAPRKPSRGDDAPVSRLSFVQKFQIGTPASAVLLLLLWLLYGNLSPMKMLARYSVQAALQEVQ